MPVGTSMQPASKSTNIHLRGSVIEQGKLAEHWTTVGAVSLAQGQAAEDAEREEEDGTAHPKQREVVL